MRYQNEHLNSDHRFKKITEKGQSVVMFDTRNIYVKNKWTYGLTGTLSFRDKKISYGHLLLGYQFNNKTEVFFRTEKVHNQWRIRKWQ